MAGQPASPSFTFRTDVQRVQVTAKQARRRLSSKANQIGGRLPSSVASFSEKLVNGTPHLFPTFSHLRQCVGDTLRTSVTPGSEFPPGRLQPATAFPPALLMRSGIGPADALRRAGVEPLVDHAGVGQNLFNHAIAHIAIHPLRSSKQDRTLTSWAFAMLRYSSGHPGCPAGDMQVFPTNRTSWHPLGRRIGALGVCLYKPFSTGTVVLRSSDPAKEPEVKFRLLSDQRDFERMVDGLGLPARLLRSPHVRAVANEAFLPSGGQANKLNRPGRLNWLKSAVISTLFDLPFGLRRALLARSVVDLERLATDRTACEAVIRRVGAGVHHVSGTCRIGRADDPMAVVDASCRVHGVAGLRVVDASVMPTVVSANTHLAVLMIGEKVAQAILDERVAIGQRPHVGAAA